MTTPDPRRADSTQADSVPPGPGRGELERIAAGHHHDPHSVLGAHPGKDGVVIRALRPMADSVAVVLDDGRRLPM
jgi:1,4-alpha-glucan branching enzyme